MNSRSPSDGIPQASAAIGAARRRIDGGEVLDLAAIQNQIAVICENAATACDSKDAPAIRASLIAILDDLEQLRISLTRQRDVVAGALRGGAPHHQAAAAYRRTLK